MRVIAWVLSILLGLIIEVFLGVYGYLRSTLPDYDGEMTIPGLKDNLEIIRDSYGMPHIYAQTEEDAYFALGFCMAQDRLFHMDVVRCVVRGRLSEILGEELISTDKLFRLSNPWDGYHGASLLYIIDFSNMKNSRRVIPTGISGNFMSPHYDDQVELWRTGKYRPFVLDRKSVEKDARYILKLLPE